MTMLNDIVDADVELSIVVTIFPLGLNARLCRVAWDGGFNESSRPAESESNGPHCGAGRYLGPGGGGGGQPAEGIVHAEAVHRARQRGGDVRPDGARRHAHHRVGRRAPRCLFLSLILSSPSPPGVTDADLSCSSTAGHVLLAIPMNLKKH